MKRVLVTGAAGFIASRVSETLLRAGNEVVGVDNLNDYYDRRLKLWRVENLKKYSGFKFEKADIEDFDAIRDIFALYAPHVVINEAARAGVRASIDNPFIYMSTNAMGCLNLLELCRMHGVKKFILASTSSIYAGQKMPFAEDIPANRSISPYAASKAAAEAVSYTYHYLYGIDVTVFRYFTVYGPAGRPDMSYFRFIKNIFQGRPIVVFGDGLQSRDFTYVDDVARGTVAALDLPGYEIINLGNSNSESLSTMIELIEESAGIEAIIEYRESQKTDMRDTLADIRKASRLLGWKPEISLRNGMSSTVSWMKENWDWLKEIDDFADSSSDQPRPIFLTSEKKD